MKPTKSPPKIGKKKYCQLKSGIDPMFKETLKNGKKFSKKYTIEKLNSKKKRKGYVPNYFGAMFNITKVAAQR